MREKNNHDSNYKLVNIINTSLDEAFKSTILNLSLPSLLGSLEITLTVHLSEIKILRKSACLVEKCVLG